MLISDADFSLIGALKKKIQSDISSGLEQRQMNDLWIEYDLNFHAAVLKAEETWS